MTDKVLISQFTAAVTEEIIRKVLQERLLQEPTSSFFDLRELAMRWNELNKPRSIVNILESDCGLGFVTNCETRELCP